MLVELSIATGIPYQALLAEDMDTLATYLDVLDQQAKQAKRRR